MKHACSERKEWYTDHDYVIKWKHFLRYWPFVRGIHRSPVNSPHKGQWRGALIFSLICAWIYGWVNNCKAGDLRRHHAHYDVTVMWRNDGLTWMLQILHSIAVHWNGNVSILTTFSDDSDKKRHQNDDISGSVHETKKQNLVMVMYKLSKGN